MASRREQVLLVSTLCALIGAAACDSGAPLSIDAGLQTDALDGGAMHTASPDQDAADVDTSTMPDADIPDDASTTSDGSQDDGGEVDSAPECELPEDCDDGDPYNGRADRVFDLTAPQPGETTSDVVHTVDGLELDASGGAHVRDGSWRSRRLPAALVSGRNVVLLAERVNSLVGGDFQDAEATNTDETVTTPGVWSGPAFHGDGSARVHAFGRAASLEFTHAERNNFVGQYFETAPGREYRLSYQLATRRLAACDAADLSDCEQFSSRLRLYGESDGAAGTLRSITIPSDQDGSPGFDERRFLTLVKHGSEDGGRYRARLMIPDCETWSVYSDANGEVTLQHYSPATSCEDEIELGHLSFQYTSDTGGGVVTLDDVSLDREDQIEISILDATPGGAGETLQSSTLDGGFAVEPLDPSVTHVQLQIDLRTDRDDVSPTVRRLLLTDGVALVIQTTPTPLTTFDAPRMGISGGVQPSSEWNDGSLIALRSLCSDPADGGAYKSCWEVLANHDATAWRISGFELDALDTTYDEADGYTMSLSSRGERSLARFMEATSYGMQPQLILGLNANYLDVHYGDDHLATPGDVATLMADYATHLVDLLDGDACDTADAACAAYGGVYPVVERWETFNEPDLETFAPTWKDLSDCEVADLQSAMAGAVRAADPSAFITSAGLSSAANASYLEDTLEALEPNFDANSFHFYPGARPEDEIAAWWSGYDAARAAAPTGASACTAPGAGDPMWEDLPVVVGEYGSDRRQYDARCDADGVFTEDIASLAAWPTWRRGFGDEEHARQVARASLTFLGMPARQLLYWGAFSAERATYAADPECWRTAAVDTKHLFERVEGTGAFDDDAGPTYYEPNQAGVALLTLARYLSSSSPRTSAVISVGGRAVDPDDHYRSVVLERSDDEIILALWWYRPYTFETRRQTDLTHFNYLAGDPDSTPEAPRGAYDAGFAERRVHDITLRGVSASGLAAVERIDLDGVVTDILTDASVVGGAVHIEGVSVSEMPTLLRIELR